MRTEKQVRRLIEKARKANAEMDAAEKESGFQSPTTGPCWQVFRTIMMAIKSGLITGDESCFAEAYAMAEQAFPRCRRMEEAVNSN